MTHIATRDYVDRHTKKVVKKGTVVKAKDNRLQELISAGVVAKKETKKKTQKK